MNEISSQGAQKRIDFLGRWALASFAVLVVLAGWLGNSINTGKFGIMFWPGVAGAVVAAVFCAGLTWITHQHIKRLEEHKND
ncbi:MAG: hypothetical protein OXU41_03515 [Gammaproteobacteria bacterium]|nr:hypothetical protein [Gammaproteobacteria bacterium]MDD9870585.1 hypothetical protein [Gammaproteobacteria bacterium]